MDIMEFIFNLLKQLATSLSPIQFFCVLVLLLAAVLGSLRFAAKSKKGGILALFGGEDDTKDNVQTQFMTSKIDTVITEMNESSERVIRAIDELREDSEKNTDALKMQMTDFLLMKKDLQVLSDTVNKQLDEFNHNFKMHDIHDRQVDENVREYILRLQESISRVAGQIDRMEEFSKNSVPEFRSYHKELSKEVSELSRDIALVERSIQTQINTVNAVKLR